MREICFATNNQHKLNEVWLLIGSDFRLLSLNDIKCFEELPETRDTLEGNSLQKAEYVYEHYRVPCFADDTGLEVDALGGAPGVYSARYAGIHKNSEDNIQLLLHNLRGNPNRKARFRTVITGLGLEDKPIVFEGIIEGEIITEKRGTSGFGYDPVFIPKGYKHTFAEMDIAQKNILSHRALAVQKLAAYLKKH